MTALRVLDTPLRPDETFNSREETRHLRLDSDHLVQDDATGEGAEPW